MESNQTGLHVQNINDLNTKGDPLCDLVDNTDASKSNPFEDFEITNPYIAVSGNIQEHSQTIDQLATIITAPQNSKKDPKKEKQQQAKKVYDKATNPQAEKKEGGNKVNENSAVTELKSQIKQNEEQIEKLSTTLLESPKDTQAIVNQIEELVDKNEKLNKQLEKELLKPSSSSD